MALLTSLEQPAATALGRAYGIDIREVKALTLGSVNSNFRLRAAGGEYFFGRIYEEQDASGARAEAHLLRGLASAGVPTAVPLPPLDSSAELSHAGKPFALYPWLEGDSLCHALLQPEHLRQLGEALARVHLSTPSLAALPAGRFGAPEILKRMRGIQTQTRAFDAELEQLEMRLSHHLERRSTELPLGLVHGDLFRDNVLWRDDKIVALLDFESASRGPFIYDLMVCALAWCYRSEFDLARVAALFEGYQSLRVLSALERSGLRGEGAIACVRFATTRITDFEMRAPEGQPPGRDYRRFLARLAALEAGTLDGVLQG